MPAAVVPQEEPAPQPQPPDMITPILERLACASSEQSSTFASTISAAMNNQNQAHMSSMASLLQQMAQQHDTTITNLMQQTQAQMLQTMQVLVGALRPNHPPPPVNPNRPLPFPQNPEDEKDWVYSQIVRIQALGVHSDSHEVILV